MKLKKYGAILIGMLYMGLLPLQAHPVIWKHGNALMFTADPTSSTLTYHRSLSTRWSLGMREQTFLDTDKRYVFGQSNWLLKRWNGTNSQGNWYALSSWGFNTASSDSVLHLGTQADWETRRFYTFLKADYFGFEDPVLQLKGRIGIAPYIGDFEAVHTWLILQIDDKVQNQDHNATIMPVIRIFKDNILMELGSNFSGSSMVSAMLHF